MQRKKVHFTCCLPVCTGVSLEFPLPRENFFLGALFLNLFNVVNKIDLTVRATNHAKLKYEESMTLLRLQQCLS